ncbi:MAG: class I adenylate-forming enzyme family protein [Acidimicrobiia bacterium]
MTAPVAPADARNCAEFFRAIGAAYGDLPAIALGERTLTYAELEEQSRALAKGLLRRGIAKGARVGILMPNSPEWAVAWAAVTRVGGIAVALSTFLKPPELARVVRHGDLHGLIMQPGFLSSDFVANVEAAFPAARDSSPELFLADAPYLRWVALVGGNAPGWARTASWLVDESDELEPLLAAAEAELHHDDPAAVIYTSGQSALPKGVTHSHGNIMRKVHYHVPNFGPQHGVEAVASMPFFWVGGIALQLLIILEVGGIVRCMDAPTSGGPALGSITRTAYFQPNGLVSALGMSETFATYAWGHGEFHAEHPICTPMEVFDPEVEIRVVTPDGTTAREGETGELRVRGRGITIGLHKVDRRDAFDADGYYRTGDEILIHDGALCFLGRLGDMIKSAGANVAPAEVERELLDLPGVAAAHVVAVDVQGRGHLVGAAVVASEGATLDQSEIVAVLRQRLSTYKVPRLIAFVEAPEVPKTPSNKIDKRRLATLISERAVGEAR